MRVPWPGQFPSLQPQAAKEELFRHYGYEAAKYDSNVRLAWDICDALANDAVMYPLWDDLLGIDPRPIIVAPVKPDGVSRNALARTYAAWLAKELSCEFGQAFFQVNDVRRDRITSRYERLVHEPLFTGPVEGGRRYIIADDVCTMGGTMTSLRGFIESRGGEVILMTSLAAGDGRPFQISLDAGTERGLIDAYEGRLATLVNSELGYDVSCLTRPEGEFLLQRPSIDAIRTGFRDGRNR